MLNTIKMAGLAVAVTLGGLTSFAAPTLAQDSFEIIIGPDGARLRARDYCERNPYYDGCRDWRRRSGERGGYDGEDDGYDNRRYRRESGRRFDRFCSTDDALDKARRMGLRRARIVGVGERSTRVAGRDDGRTVIVRFGRRGGCPVIG
jgi:hypothetical protein